MPNGRAPGVDTVIMENTMRFGKYRAEINYDHDIGFFRGEFIGLNGGADFYADTKEDLRKEGETSLSVFLDFATEKDLEA
jgi:predicted HicB family RNase H-like nuclease